MALSKITNTGINNITVNSSGNVGIGTSSPSTSHKLTLDHTSNYGGISLKQNGTQVGQIIQEGGTGNVYVDADSGSLGGGLILRTSGTERMRIDGSGRVTMPYQPGFSVRQLAQANIDCSSSDYIAFRNILTTNFNTGNHFSSSTGRFTAPVAGNYIFGTTLRYDAFSGSYFYVSISKNGSTFGARELTSLTGSYLHASVHTIINMAAGDYVNVTLRNTGDSNIHIDHDCNFYGYLLG